MASISQLTNLSKGANLEIGGITFQVTDLAIYEDDEGNEWYEYKLRNPESGDVLYLSVDPEEEEVEIGERTEVDLPEDLSQLEESLKVGGRVFFYEDDYEGYVRYPWRGNRGEEVEIYEYTDPVKGEYLTLELYWEDDDELDDWEAFISRPIDPSNITLL